MRIKVILAIVCFVVAAGSGIYMKLATPAHPLIWLILSLCFTSFSLFNFITASLLAIPFRMQVLQSKWQGKTPIETFKDLFVHIPKSVHKKGRSPKVTFIRYGGVDNTIQVLTEVRPNGDVFIFNKPNSTMPPWKEFDIEIRG